MNHTIDQKEVDKFNNIANEWWSADGKFKPLHKFNPCRISYIKEQISNHFTIDINSFTPLKNINILDVGCGGGLLCEPLTRLGSNVVGIDAGEKNIKIAKNHSQQNGLQIDYRYQDVEELAQSKEKFDVVLAMEIIEHVADVEKFIIATKNCLKVNGLLMFATLNRTIKSYFNAIIGAEILLRWLPRGTHDWKKFLKPSQINKIATNNNLQLIDLSGFSYNLLRDQWKKTNDVSSNYIITFKL